MPTWGQEGVTGRDKEGPKALGPVATRPQCPQPPAPGSRGGCLDPPCPGVRQVALHWRLSAPPTQWRLPGLSQPWGQGVGILGSGRGTRETSSRAGARRAQGQRPRDPSKDETRTDGHQAGVGLGPPATSKSRGLPGRWQGPTSGPGPAACPPLIPGTGGLQPHPGRPPSSRAFPWGRAVHLCCTGAREPESW